MRLSFTLTGAPRTKKNSPRVVPLISADGVMELIKALIAAASHREAVRAIMQKINFAVQPAEGYEEWFGNQYLLRSDLHEAISAAGIKLPILEPLSIEALVYRDAERGDFNGYTDAIADALQAELWKCGSCKSKTMLLDKCRKCGASIAGMSHARKGLGIIGDDAQIQHWDGTRLLKDATRPRIEITIRTIPVVKPDAPQGRLF